MTQMWIFQDLDRDLGRDLGQDFRLKFGMKFGMKFGLGVMALMLSGVPLASADQLASANQPTTAGFSGEIEMGSAMSAAPASKVASGVGVWIWRLAVLMLISCQPISPPGTQRRLPQSWRPSTSQI
jgi:hypothetical protein